MNKYEYSGPVMNFERCIDRCWSATTYAHSEGKARANFMYQFKKQNNLMQNVKITLPGEITQVG